MTTEVTSGFVVLTLRAFEDEGAFVSECVELQTASMGESLEDAIANAYDAALVYLSGALELGELDRVVRERELSILPAPPDHIELYTSVRPGDLVKAVIAPVGGAILTPS